MTLTRSLTAAGTGSVKWDKYKGRDIIPLWVADMDFQAAPAVLQALRKRVEHGVFGYTLPPDELAEALQSYLNASHGWRIEEGWITWLPGVVPAMAAACRAVGEDGDDVITTVPIYPHFLSVHKAARRNLIAVPPADARKPLDLRSRPHRERDHPSDSAFPALQSA